MNKIIKYSLFSLILIANIFSFVDISACNRNRRVSPAMIRACIQRKRDLAKYKRFCTFNRIRRFCNKKQLRRPANNRRPVNNILRRRTV